MPSGPPAPHRAGPGPRATSKSRLSKCEHSAGTARQKPRVKQKPTGMFGGKMEWRWPGWRFSAPLAPLSPSTEGGSDAINKTVTPLVRRRSMSGRARPKAPLFRPAAAPPRPMPPPKVPMPALTWIADHDGDHPRPADRRSRRHHDARKARRDRR